MKADFFANNRKKLSGALKEGSLTILFAGSAPHRSADETYRFVPNRNFYYMTGIDRENIIFALKKSEGKIEEMLFIEENDPVMERWVGRKLSEEEAKAASGISKIRKVQEFPAFVHSALQNEKIETVYLNLELMNWGAGPSKAHEFARELQVKYPQAKVENVYADITQLRVVKEPEEVDKIRRAIAITKDGIENVWKHAKPGMKENELEAYFNFTLQTQGVKETAFPTIAASGKNATILHYVNNDDETKDGDLVLLDLGATYDYYSADLTRTFPINGKFSERQKAVYNVVLQALKETTELVKPGLNFAELNKHTKKVLAEGCRNLGLIEKDEEIDRYYYHGVSHSLGLDTHDVGRYRDMDLVPGMVLTIEPGLYIAEENIGIRLEDDVLVTVDGHENLSAAMIRTVEDIESFLANR
ncbi:MAG TPA: aminopeptidase P family protein [Bacillales bacterium]|nr:aminopeptidase P family protein [Bacillales bacterium]